MKNRKRLVIAGFIGLWILCLLALRSSGATPVVQVEFTRPADTNAYAAKDVIANSTSAPVVQEIANFATSDGGSGYLVKARLMTDLKTFTARVRLHIYAVAPAAIADNAPFAMLYANRANRVGYIDFAAASTEDATTSTAAGALRDDLRMYFVCAPNSRSLFFVPEILDAATPASLQKFFFEFSFDHR